MPEGWRGRSRHLALWDGDCGICRRLAVWATRQDREGRLLVLAYQQVPDPPLGAALRAECARAMQVVRSDGTLLRAGRAAIFCLEQLGARWARVLRLPPLVWLTELGYWLVARNRGLIGRLLPAPKESSTGG